MFLRLQSAFILPALMVPAVLFADSASGVWPAVSAPAGVTVPAGYRYVWGDEFSGPDGSAPDSKKWNYEHGFVRNKEAQFYTRDRRENARIEKGRLVIEARKESFTEAGHTACYTSASLITEGRFAFRYGRVEVSAKLPKGVGTWPAIWMMGEDRLKVGWPKCGEIDIMEHLGYEEGTVYSTLHTPGPNGVKHTSQGGVLRGQHTTAGFHVYGMDWSPEKIVLLFDGKPVFTHLRSGPNPKGLAPVFDKPFYLILNLAIGGEWGGAKGIDESAFPCRMEVASVRVFQKN